ncbi:MAG: dihydrofolate reductase family protein [Acidimicrobiia bacterium]
MRKLIVNTFISLDGVMQAPGGPEEDPSGGFALGGWSVNYWDDGMGERMGEFMGKPFDLLLGRKTYEIFAGHWPQVKDDPAADALNGARKYVASKTLSAVDWQNSELLEGDVPSGVKKLKEAGGPEIQVHGSSELLQTLIANDLIDQYQLWFFPVVLGKGKRLFGKGAVPFNFKLVDSQSFSKGVFVGLFERAGDIEPGSFALDTT